MTVGELMEKLRSHPEDLRVVVRGYEGGYHDADTPEPLAIVLNIHGEWYYGPHDDEDGCTSKEWDEVEKVPALLIG